jgi:uncharacterized membrane protein
MNFTQMMETVAKGFELLGVSVILAGLILASYQAMVLVVRHDAPGAYVKWRSMFGRSVLLGLEVLVAGDIIRTVAIDPTIDNLLVLGLLVLIRTFLSWSLEVEIDGRWPWQAASAREADPSDAQTCP